MPVIRLKYYHTKLAFIEHPLLDGAVSLTEDELVEYIRTGGSPVKGLRSCLRHMVGRYVANWPQTTRFLDDMVSEGFVAISRLSNEILLDFPPGYVILKVASQRIQDRVEEFLNPSQTCLSPSLSTQKRLLWGGVSNDHPISSITELPESSHPPKDGDEAIRDILEAFAQLTPRDEIDAAILRRENWGRPQRELASELGVSRKTISWRKLKLFKQYQELTK